MLQITHYRTVCNLHNMSRTTWLVHYFKILTLLLKINAILFEIRLLVFTYYSSLKF